MLTSTASPALRAFTAASLSSEAVLARLSTSLPAGMLTAPELSFTSSTVRVRAQFMDTVPAEGVHITSKPAAADLVVEPYSLSSRAKSVVLRVLLYFASTKGVPPTVTDIFMAGFPMTVLPSARKPTAFSPPSEDMSLPSYITTPRGSKLDML